MPESDSQCVLGDLDDCCTYAGRQNRGKEGGTEKVFLSPIKHINIPKRVTNLDDSQKHALCRTAFEYYDNGEFLSVKKATLALR